jgi:hypothetical protein
MKREKTSPLKRGYTDIGGRYILNLSLLERILPNEKVSVNKGIIK